MTGFFNWKGLIILMMVLMICIATSFILSYFGFSAGKAPGAKASLYGNSLSNLNQGGFFAYYDGFLFKSDAQGLHKESVKTGEKTYLVYTHANNINVIDGMVYYTSNGSCSSNYASPDGRDNIESEPNLIYRMKIDGERPYLLGSVRDCCHTLIVTSEMIIYTTHKSYIHRDKDSENVESCWYSDLWRMNLDGTGQTKLAEKIGCFFDVKIWVEDDWVYYLCIDPNGNNNLEYSLKRIDTGGRQSVQVIDPWIFDYVISDGWLYYITVEDASADRYSYAFYKKDLNNLYKKSKYLFDIPFKLTFAIYKTMCIYNGRIYLLGNIEIHEEMYDCIYYMGIDEMKFKPFFIAEYYDSEVQFIQSMAFINGWMYFSTVFDAYRIKIDSSDGFDLIALKNYTLVEKFPKYYMYEYYYEFPFSWSRQ